MRARLATVACVLVGCGAPDLAADDASSDALTVDVTDAPDAADASDALTRDGSDAFVADASDALTRDGLDAVVPDASDASATDAADVPDAAPPPPMGAVLYTADRSLSPITADVVSALAAIVRRGTGTLAREFSKVGDSNTVNTGFLACFAGANVDLAGRPALQPTLDLFRTGRLGGTTPFDRVSLAATVGWSVGSALAGSPSPVARELAAVTPRYATVMFGTNDIQARDIDRYAVGMWTLTDALLAAGVIPLVTSIPARADNADADAWVPRYNAVARALAQSHRVPYIDAHRELARIPRRGLGGDNLHLNVYAPSGAARGCVFTAAGLQYGHNVRNLLTLQTLDRVVSVTARGAAAPDRDAPRLAGDGSVEAPYVIAALPFVDGGDTRASNTRAIARYTGCMAAADESGPERWYRLDVARPTRVRAQVFVRGATDVDLHLVDRTGSAAGCVRRDDKTLTVDLAPGRWYLVVDSYVAAGTSRAGEYLFTVLAE